MEVKSWQVVFGPNDHTNVVIRGLGYQEVGKAIENIADRNELIILGDLNGRTGSRYNEQYGECVVNDYRDRLIELCQEPALKVTNV